MTPYEVLGVPNGSDEATVARAYIELAKQFHPDQHPDASPAQKWHLEQTMARINAAYNELKQNARLTTPDTESGPDIHAHSRHQQRRHQDETSHGPRPPRGDQCSICGYSPAELVRFQSQRAYLFAAQVHQVEMPLCRDCALAAGRDEQNRTLLTGWWGVLSFFRNFYIVWINATGLRAAHRLPPPQPPAEQLLTPLKRPMHPGGPVIGRAGFWVVLAVLTVIVIFLAMTSSEDSRSTSSTRAPSPPAVAPQGTARPPTTVRPVSWAVGNCVRGSFMLEPVSCVGQHDGWIIEGAATPRGCPFNADSYVEFGTRVWCIKSRR